MMKFKRQMTVVALEQTGDNMLTNHVQVIAENGRDSLTFTTGRSNYPDLGATITVTIEQE